MTENFEQLSKEMTIFADLRNVMDLTVMATLIARNDWTKRRVSI